MDATNNIINSNYLLDFRDCSIGIAEYSNNNIFSNNIIISDTIQAFSGILLRYDTTGNEITGNEIIGCEYGILLNSGDSILSDNVCIDNYIGMYFAHSSNNEVTNNVLEGNNIGIYLDNGCTNDLVSENNVINNTEYGILIGDGGGHIIIKNYIKNNKYGFVVRFSSSNEILSNFFLNNTRNALFQSCKNRWDGNYWNEPRTYPKIVFGMIGFFGLIPWIEIDWHPSQEPYGIS